ncbi:uncharacterized protein [Dysidea avara]
MYNRTGEVQLQSDDQVTTGSNGFLEANISLTGDDRIEFQSGDIVGYYHPPNVRYSLRDIQTDGYVLYRFDRSSPPTSVDLSERNAMLNNRQPLIQFIIDIQCDDLSAPSNGEITSCSSDRVGVGYEGDTCNFTCNTGYELTGSDTRTCQSDGSWSGTESMCKRVRCPPLNNPNNGMVRCILGDDGVSSYLDFCRYTCNTGYELTGSRAGRTCQADGSWSGFADSCTIMQCPSSSLPMNSMLAESCSNTYQSMCDLQCEEGFNSSGDPSYVCDVLSDGSVMWMTSGGGWSCERVQCTTLPSPSNGNISCDFTSAPRYEDQCSFLCDPGYELTGSSTRQCLSNGSWSGTDVTWVFTGSGVTCSPVPCVSLSDPENGNVSCPSNTSVFQDTCTYYCNRGYQLEGNRQTRCSADGTWSSEPVTCTILTCNDPEVEITNSQSVGDCNITYGSSCLLGCSSGYSVSGNGEHVCDDVNDEGTSVKWRSVGDFACVAAIADQNDGNGAPVAIIGGAVAAAVVLMIILVLLCCGVWLLRRSRNKSSYPVESNVYVNEGAKDVSMGQITLNNSNALYDSPYSQYDQPPVETAMDEQRYNYSVKYTFVDQAISRIEGIYEYDTGLDNQMYETAALMEEEQKIYDTPYEDEDCGPIYCEPPTEEEELYGAFDGKIFYKLCHQDIRILEHLGSGEFGKVAHGLLNGNVEVALKTLNAGVNEKERVRFLQEAAIMCQFDHENVIKLFGVVTEAPVMIVLEYMSRGDLRNLLIQLQPSDGEVIHAKLPQFLLKFCQEIAAGMAYLSGKQFVHRDLAARNILVSEKCTCKIADFGMSRDLLNDNYYITSGGKIPVKWTAPEALHYRKYSVFSDVWSYGCVLYEIWSLGYKPFEGKSSLETLEKVDRGYRLPPPPGCSRTMYRVMIRCWHPDPRSRPQFGQITKLLAGNGNYLLGWSDEDSQVAGEDGMKLGAPLGAAKNLYADLQCTYK